MPTPSLHFRYRSFIATISRSAPYASPNHGCRFPLSIWPDSIEFTCSLKWPLLCFPTCGTGTANFTPDAVWPVSSGRPPHSVTDTNVTICFPHRSLLYRGFFVGSLSFSSTVLTYRNLCSRFSLSAHHTSVSAKCSARRFNGCSGKPPSEGLSIGYQ